MSEMVIGADIRDNARRQFSKQADAYSKGSTFTDKNQKVIITEYYITKKQI